MPDSDHIVEGDNYCIGIEVRLRIDEEEGDASEATEKTVKAFK